MNVRRKLIASALVLLLAANAAAPVFAEEKTSSKEEVVYIMTEADGTVKNVDIVNIFDGGDVVDYGNYSSVKMLTTKDEIHQSGDKITFSSSSDRVYYQGAVENSEIPWNISIRYFLDNKEYPAYELAGKSGRLEIEISITENDKCSGAYFDNYALQASLSLDTERCDNIKADGATIANVGSDKQISYTVLPGKGLNASVTADVEDFDMEAASVNGVKLDIDVDVDEEELTEKVSELMTALAKLDEGTSALYYGAQTAEDGSGRLNDGILSLNGGLTNLDSGIAELQKGMTSVKEGLDMLDEQSSALRNGSEEIESALKAVQQGVDKFSVSSDQLHELTEASNSIKNGIKRVSDGALALKNSVGYDQYKAVMSEKGIDIESVKQGNAQTVEECYAQMEKLNGAIEKLEQESGSDEQIALLKEQAASLDGIVRLLNANSYAMTGTESYLGEISVGVNELYEGASSLETGYGEFDAAVYDLAGTLSGMAENMSKLSEAMDMLVESYEKLDDGLENYTGGVASLVSGYDRMLAGISQVAYGSKDLLQGSGNLAKGSAGLYDGIVELCGGAEQLNQATGSLRSASSDMDSQLREKINDILSSVQGDETETVSFASQKNTNVESVQFVIKTDPVEKTEAAEKIQEPAESKSLWQKFIQLFGF